MLYSFTTETNANKRGWVEFEGTLVSIFLLKVPHLKNITHTHTHTRKRTLLLKKCLWELGLRMKVQILPLKQIFPRLGVW